MKIKVKIIGPLIYQVGFSEKEIEMPAGATVGMLLELLAIPEQRPMIVTRNGRAIAPQDALQESDRIAISPIYSGG
jgi:sulfur carrier protein ThiS